MQIRSPHFLRTQYLSYFRALSTFQETCNTVTRHVLREEKRHYALPDCMLCDGSKRMKNSLGITVSIKVLLSTWVEIHPLMSTESLGELEPVEVNEAYSFGKS